MARVVIAYTSLKQDNDGSCHRRVNSWTKDFIAANGTWPGSSHPMDLSAKSVQSPKLLNRTYFLITSLTYTLEVPLNHYVCLLSSKVSRFDIILVVDEWSKVGWCLHGVDFITCVTLARPRTIVLSSMAFTRSWNDLANSATLNRTSVLASHCSSGGRVFISLMQASSSLSNCLLSVGRLII